MKKCHYKGKKSALNHDQYILLIFHSKI